MNTENGGRRTNERSSRTTFKSIALSESGGRVVLVLFLIVNLYSLVLKCRDFLK